jgi:hypothetical protein
VYFDAIQVDPAAFQVISVLPSFLPKNRPYVALMETTAIAQQTGTIRDDGVTNRGGNSREDRRYSAMYPRLAQPADYTLFEDW